MEETLIRWLDWPPLWTLGGALLIAILGWVGFPIGFGIYGPGLGLACVVLALWLMGSAVWTMRQAGTTINPRGMPTALVTGGVFAISRNPVYLGDVVLLLAAAFWWDAPLGLAVAAGFVLVVTDRFILSEEERLGEVFGDEAAHWFHRTRRWL
ncbi:isoprenylcysteine carboxylmethyltransferase family protein [Paracoccaceae bacterium]